MYRRIREKFLYWEKSIEYHEIESAFRSEKEKEVMMCEYPVSFLSQVSPAGKEKNAGGDFLFCLFFEKRKKS